MLRLRPMETTSTDRRTDVLKASPRMFESEILDRLSRVHPSVPVILFLPAILVLLGLGSPAWASCR